MDNHSHFTMNSVDMEAVWKSTEPLIALALGEDLGSGDVTTDSLFDSNHVAKAVFQAKANGILAGWPVVNMVFRQVDPSVKFEKEPEDGIAIKPGDKFAVVQGTLRGLLKAERASLNFLQHLSGVATLAHAFQEAVRGTKAVILDTRKTLPGFRALEKYAVRMGGAANHRMGLYDMALIKDNHIEAAGSMSATIQKIRNANPDLPIEVEVTSLDQLGEALKYPIQRIMLDNMTLDTMREAVRITGGRIPLEASGGVRLETVAAIAATGVDFISVGAITHSAPALDISMEILSDR